MLITSNVKKSGPFPENLFGKSKDTNERKDILNNVKKELEQKQNYTPKLSMSKIDELNKQLLAITSPDDINKIKERINS